MDVITRFATDTRHKDHQLGNVQLIAKKLLATQVPVSTFDAVYPFVCDDKSSIEFRAPNVMSQYDIEPGFLSKILDQNSVDLSKYAIVNDYIEKVKPEEGKELITFFLHGQRDNELHTFIEKDLGTDQDKQLYTRIRSYVPDPSMNQKEIAREIGFLINALEIPLIKDETLFLSPNIEEALEEEEEEEEPRCNSISLEHAESTKWTTDHERSLRTNPVMQAFKKKTRLTNQFPSVKAAKQLILATVTTPDIMYRNVDPLLGKRQYKESISKPILEEKQEWDHLLTIVDSFDTDAIDAMIDTIQARDFYTLTKFKGTKQEFIKALINAHSPFTDTKPRYLKRYPNGLTEDIVKEIIKG